VNHVCFHSVTQFYYYYYYYYYYHYQTLAPLAPCLLSSQKVHWYLPCLEVS